MSGRQLGTVGLIGIGWFVVAVLTLHVIESEFSPTDSFVSDYALGDYGWLMQSAFFGAGAGTIAIALGLRKTLALGKRVTASIVLLVIAGIGFFVAIFKTDPGGATETTTPGNLHSAGAVVLFFSLLVGAWMLRGVFKRDPIWEPFAKRQMWFAITYTVTMTATFATPEDGPGGLSQRIFATAMMAWLATLAWSIRRTSQTTEAS